MIRRWFRRQWTRPQPTVTHHAPAFNLDWFVWWFASWFRPAGWTPP